MKLISLTLLLVGTAIAQPRGECPRPKPGFGACVFNPDINCSSDSECQNNQICCPSGCNRECMTALNPEDKCPPTGIPPSVGACIFDPKVNCVDDSECSNSEVCCPQGCNKVCKKLYTRKPAPYTPGPDIPSQAEDKCPAAPVRFGACVFDPKVNCVDDNECQDGKVCCPDGCNKICKFAKNSEKTDPSKIPIDNPKGKCPNAPVTFGACVFDPKVNCMEDSECKNGKICCNSGCNKSCVNPEPLMVPQATKP